jgi:hypothetical protein
MDLPKPDILATEVSIESLTSTARSVALAAQEGRLRRQGGSRARETHPQAGRPAGEPTGPHDRDRGSRRVRVQGSAHRRRRMGRQASATRLARPRLLHRRPPAAAEGAEHRERRRRWLDSHTRTSLPHSRASVRGRLDRAQMMAQRATLLAFGSSRRARCLTPDRLATARTQQRPHGPSTSATSGTCLSRRSAPLQHPHRCAGRRELSSTADSDGLWPKSTLDG